MVHCNIDGDMSSKVVFLTTKCWGSTLLFSHRVNMQLVPTYTKSAVYHISTEPKVKNGLFYLHTATHSYAISIHSEHLGLWRCIWNELSSKITSRTLLVLIDRDTNCCCCGKCSQSNSNWQCPSNLLLDCLGN